MEGFASVITGAHLFERGSPRGQAGRSFGAWFSLAEAAQLRYWPTERDALDGREPIGSVATGGISGVRVSTPRRAGGGSELQLQFELRMPDGKQRMIRMVPEDPVQCQAWATQLSQITRGRKSAATSLAGAATRAAEGWRAAAVEKEGLLFTPYLGSGVADEPPWLAVKVRVERRGGGGGGDPSYVLRYGTAEAADVDGTGGGGLVNAETIGMETVHRVRFGFGGAGSRAATAETKPGRNADRKSCHFQFSIADTDMDSLQLVEQTVAAADAGRAGSPGRRQPAQQQPQGAGERVLRLRTRTTRECIEWVHLLRKLSVDRLLYPELLPVGVQRLLRALFHRALRNADGTVREAELGRQLQHDRVLSAVLPEEFRAAKTTAGHRADDHHAEQQEDDDAATAAVEAAAAAAWVFDGEEAAQEVLADAVAAEAAGEGPLPSHQRSMTLETFVHEMNSRHHTALEAAAEQYEVCTSAEALAKLRADFGLPEHMGLSGAEIVWVVEEKMGLPHEQAPLLPPPPPGSPTGARGSGGGYSAAVMPPMPIGVEMGDAAAMAAGLTGTGTGTAGGDRDSDADMPPLPPTTSAAAAAAAAAGAGEAVDEALVLLFAQLGQHIVLIPEEDPSSSKAVAMEGLVRVLNTNSNSNDTLTDAAAAAAAAAAGADGGGGGSFADSTPQQLVDYEHLDEEGADGAGGGGGGRRTTSLSQLRAAKAGMGMVLDSYDSEADPGSPGGWPLKGLRDRPYGSYRRSRRRPTPTAHELQRLAVHQHHQQQHGLHTGVGIGIGISSTGSPSAGGLGAVPSGEAPKMSSTLQARLAIGLRHSPYRSTSNLSESEEVALALTPTESPYKHLSHAKQKERRRQDFEDLMIDAAAAAATNDGDTDAQQQQQQQQQRKGVSQARAGSPGSRPGSPSSPAEGQGEDVVDREEARRLAIEKRKKSSEVLAEKTKKGEAARKAIAAGKFVGRLNAQQNRGAASSGGGGAGGGAGAGDGVEAAGAAVREKLGGAGASAGQGDWSSRVGVGNSAASVLAELGL